MPILQLPLLPELVCAEHGIHDVLPCPWPGCPNGVAGPGFEVESIERASGHLAYRRQAWPSPVGGEYFTWDSQDLCGWHTARTTVLNECRRLGLLAPQLPRLVYHYTSIEGLVAILQSESIWLSDYSYLNDKREISYGAEIVTRVARQVIGSAGDAASARLLEHWVDALLSLENRVCIASFSSHDDSLSQWRSYGPVALGFEAASLAGHVIKSIFRPIEYDRARQEKRVLVSLQHLCKAYELDAGKPGLADELALYRQADPLIEMIAFFKDPSFRDEQEFRLAYIEDAALLGRLGETPTPKRFRIARSKLLPYVSSRDILPNAQDRKPFHVREVVLGPETSDLLQRGLREFLDAHGMGDVALRQSSVPYRA